LQILGNLSIGELLNEFIIGFVVLFVAFIIGMFLARAKARKRQWDDSIRIAFIVSLLWLIINIFFELPFLYFLGNSIIFDPLRIAIETIIISVVVETYYNKKFTESLIFTIIILVLLYAIATFIGSYMKVFIKITGSKDLLSAGMMYYFCSLLFFGITVFFVSWGDKMQFVKDKKLIILITAIPGFYYLTEEFYSQGEGFMQNYVTVLFSAIMITIIVGSIVKIISYKTLSFEEYRDLIVLEKDKKILETKDLKVYYPLIGGVFLKRQFASVKAVDGITFHIKTGETLGLVGESGCGKTTVANAILGLVQKVAGDIIFSGEPIPNHYTKHLRRKIQMVFQDPDASLNPRMKIVEIIAEPLKNLLGITKKDEIRRRVLKLLDEVSLKREHMDRFPHEFSGGQKQRIIIARALASNPELIILDEPTSALDVSVQAQILNLLKELQKTYGYGFLFITHNLAVVNHIADRIAVMYLGKLVEIGETNQIFSKPTHPYTQALLASRTEIDPSNKEISFVIKGEVPSPIAPPPGCSFNPRCVSDARTNECMRETPHKIKIEEGHYIWCVNPPVWMQKEVSLEHKDSETLTYDN